MVKTICVPAGAGLSPANCIRKCESFIDLHLKQADSFVAGFTHDAAFIAPGLCEISWRKVVRHMLCEPTDCSSSIEYFCGRFKNSIMLQAPDVGSQSTDRKLWKSSAYSQRQLRVDHEKHCFKHNDRACRWYSGCDVCMYHYIWLKRSPLPHKSCWLSYYYGRSETKFCKFTPNKQLPAAVVSVAAAKKMNKAVKVEGCCVKDGYTFIRPEQERNWIQGINIETWNSKSKSGDLVVPINYKGQFD